MADDDMDYTVNTPAAHYTQRSHANVTTVVVYVHNTAAVCVVLRIIGMYNGLSVLLVNMSFIKDSTSV